MMLFLDTEWADVPASKLVSLALVGHDDRFVFYAERDPLPEKSTDFVCRVVYPLLRRGDAAMKDSAFGERLRAFIDHVASATGERPTIAFDYFADRSFFDYAYRGLESESDSHHNPPPVDSFDLNRMNPYYARSLDEHFEDDPNAAAQRHNALIDAFAARCAYIAAVAKTGGRIT